MFTTLFAPSAQVGSSRKASNTRMAEIFPMVNSISGTPVEPSAFSLPGCRAAVGDVNRYMMQRESLDNLIKTALRSIGPWSERPGKVGGVLQAFVLSKM